MITNDSYQEKISDNEQMEELQTEERLNGGDDSYRPEHGENQMGSLNMSELIS